MNNEVESLIILHSLLKVIPFKKFLSFAYSYIFLCYIQIVYKRYTIMHNLNKIPLSPYISYPNANEIYFLMLLHWNKKLKYYLKFLFIATKSAHI